MRKWTTGFIIIEWLIYFFLIVSVLTGIFHYSVTVNQQIARLQAQSASFFQLCIVQEKLAKEIMLAPAKKEKWQEIGTQLLWWQNEKKICWKLKDNNLIRVEQIFDKTHQHLLQTKKSVVAQNIAELSFSPHLKQTKINELGDIVEGITIFFKEAGCNRRPMKRLVMLRNRVFI